MSDFFGDDFTAELKSYFIGSLILEVEKFIDLVEDSQWKRIHLEVIEQSKVWAVDAKTNEFLHLMDWLEGYEERTRSLVDATELVASLEAVKNYAESLRDSQDSAELAEKYSQVAQSQKQAIFLQCSFGNQEFAVPLLSVVEIIGNLPLFQLPQKKAGLLGVIPFRGEAIPVVNFQEYGFFNSESDKAFFVVCEHEGARFSLQVTKTEDLVNLRDAELTGVNEQSALIQASFVKQFFIKDGKSIMILDLEKLAA